MNRGTCIYSWDAKCERHISGEKCRYSTPDNSYLLKEMFATAQGATCVRAFCASAAFGEECERRVRECMVAIFYQQSRFVTLPL